MVPANEVVPLGGRHVAAHMQLMEQQQQQIDRESPVDPALDKQLSGLPGCPQPHSSANLSSCQLELVFSTAAATAATAVGSMGTGPHSAFSDSHSGAGGERAPAGASHSGMSGISGRGPRAVGMAEGHTMLADGWSAIGGVDYRMSTNGGGGSGLLSGFPSLVEASPASAAAAGHMAKPSSIDGGRASGPRGRSTGGSHVALRAVAGDDAGGNTSPRVKAVFGGFCTASIRPHSAGLRPHMAQAPGSPAVEASLAASLPGGGHLGSVPASSPHHPFLLQLAATATQRSLLSLSSSGQQQPRRPMSGLAATVGGGRGAAASPPPSVRQSQDMPRVQLAGRSGSRSVIGVSGSLPSPPGLGAASAAAVRSCVSGGKQHGTMGESGQHENADV